MLNESARSSRDASIADSLLKYNRNLPAQQCFCAPRDFVLNRSDQLRSGSGYVASQDENLRIESDYSAHMHRAAPATLSMGSSGHPPDTEAIFRAAAGGDECARYVVDRALEYLKDYEERTATHET